MRRIILAASAAIAPRMGRTQHAASSSHTRSIRSALRPETSATWARGKVASRVKAPRARGRTTAIFGRRTILASVPSKSEARRRCEARARRRSSGASSDQSGLGDTHGG